MAGLVLVSEVDLLIGFRTQIDFWIAGKTLPILRVGNAARVDFIETGSLADNSFSSRQRVCFGNPA